MLNNFFLVPLASVLCLGTGCIITGGSNDDDGTSESASAGTETSSGTSAGTGAADTGSDTGSDTGGPVCEPGACGWGPVDGADFGNAYVCGGDGEDPDSVWGYACPDGLEEGGACGDVSGRGCCDANGDLWYCGESGDEQFLVKVCCEDDPGTTGDGTAGTDSDGTAGTDGGTAGTAGTEGGTAGTEGGTAGTGA